MNMRHLLWALLTLAALAVGIWIVLGAWNPTNGFELFVVMVFFMGSPIGGFWMLYRSIRYEKKPLIYIILSFAPLAFLWYYFERVRPLKLQSPRSARQSERGE
jgi:hypothetical protein